MLFARNPFNIRNRYYFLIDLVIFTLSAFASYVLRLEGLAFASDALRGLVVFLMFAMPIRLAIFALMGIYKRHWLNAGPSELLTVAAASLISGGIIFLTVAIFAQLTTTDLKIPRFVPITDTLIVMIAVGVSRFSSRAYFHLRTRWLIGKIDPLNKKRVLIIGAGNTGTQIVSALEYARQRVNIIGFLDDDVAKVGAQVRGYRVLGKVADLPSVTKRWEINQAVIAMPGAPGSVIRQIAADADRLKLDYKIIPGMYELISGRVSVNTLRPLAIDDLLRRAPVNLRMDDIGEYIQGRTVLITGAGGSIGSELARQIARFIPAKLILLGHGENSLFATEVRLRMEAPNCPVSVVLCDVRDSQRLCQVFEQHRPQVVFHAAAHKHVNMLETNLIEAVTNNILGTRNIIERCNAVNVERMVLISTDKAVTPTSIMGTTKRVAELLIMDAAAKAPNRFVAVRFGNVLGSRGSVVPLFQQQIAAGGPITITDERMTRYFMSIPEAVLLVLKAGSHVDSGSLYVLNMGDPVRIIDLAHDMIRLSGLEVGRDVDIVITGAKPGEKLHEDLFWEYEHSEPIEEGAIYRVTLPDEHQRERVHTGITFIDDLIVAAHNHSEENVRRLLREIVFDHARTKTSYPVHPAA